MDPQEQIDQLARELEEARTLLWHLADRLEQLKAACPEVLELGALALLAVLARDRIQSVTDRAVALTTTEA